MSPRGEATLLLGYPGRVFPNPLEDWLNEQLDRFSRSRFAKRLGLWPLWIATPAVMVFLGVVAYMDGELEGGLLESSIIAYCATGAAALALVVAITLRERRERRLRAMRARDQLFAEAARRERADVNED